MSTTFFLTFTTAAKFIGAGLATIGVVGAGAGIGVLFPGSVTALSRILYWKINYSNSDC
jgi:F0F1-type ATP synthase membrane subunit c/vacuolar-type H+-ATPase subunit K